MADIMITEAPDVETIARELIRDYHPHLAEASIRYLRSTQDKKDKGKSVSAHIGKFNDLQRYLASGTSCDVAEGEQYYLITYEAYWDFDADQRRACIDHELSHLVEVGRDKITDEIKLGFVGHDVEEFSAVIQRHGLWNTEVRNFEAQARQMSLDGLMRESQTKAAMVDEIAEELDREGIPYERDASVSTGAMRAAG